MLVDGTVVDGRPFSPTEELEVMAGKVEVLVESSGVPCTQ